MRTGGGQSAAPRTLSPVGTPGHVLTTLKTPIVNGTQLLRKSRINTLASLPTTGFYLPVRSIIILSIFPSYRFNKLSVLNVSLFFIVYLKPTNGGLCYNVYLSTE